MLSPNPFDQFDTVPSDPGFTGVIPGVPKPKEPKDPLDHTLKVLQVQKAKREEAAANPPKLGTSTVTGPEYLKTLDKPTAALVSALAEGRKSFPSGAALRAPYWQEMLTHVSNYDPGFDETQYTQRAATRRSYFAGTAGPAKSIRALNTAIGHLGMLADQIDDTASHNFTPLNAVENTASAMFGSHGPTQFKQTAENLASELTGVYREAGGAEADIDRYIGQLSPNASEEQKRSAIGNTVKLLKSKLDALNYQYGQGMGVAGKNLPEFLDAHAQEVFNKYALWADDPSKDPGAPGAGPSGGGPGGGSGGDTPPGVSEMTPEQQAKDKAFLATKPTPEQYTAFLSTLVGGPVDADLAAKRLKGALAGGGYTGTVEDKQYQDKINKRMAEEDALHLSRDPASTLHRQGATLNLSDEAAGVGNAIGRTLTSPFTGHFDPLGEYRLERDVERQRIADARNRLGWGGTVIEGLSGLASASPTSALAALSPRQAIIQGARGGAVGSALAGFGSGEGAGQSTSRAVVGGVLGATVGAVAPYVGNRIVARGVPRGMAPELAEASQAEGVDLIRPMVDPASRGKFGELESNPASQATIREGVQRVRGQMANRAQALGGDGTALETDAAGGIVQGAARRYIQRSRGVADRLYNRARSLAGGTRFVPENAIGEIEAQAAQLRANPETNAGEIRFLEGLHSDLAAPGGKTVEELRQLRQSLRGRISEQNLTHTQAEARAMGALDSAQRDVAANLPREAATAYRRADSFYRERMVHVDDILDTVLGGNVQQGQARLSGEAAFKRIKAMAAPGGDNRRLAGLLRDMEPQERQDISATIANSLGRRSPEEPFSADRFITQTNQLSPQARRTLFGEEGAQSIANLRSLSQALKDAGGDVNYSRSGSNVIRYMARNFVGKITGLGGAGAVGFEAGGVHGAIGGAATAAAAGAVGAGLKVLSARAMVNPRVSRWLAQAATASTPTQARQAVRGLTLIISREPSLAPELVPLRNFLDQRVDRLAANPQEQDDQQQ